MNHTIPRVQEWVDQSTFRLGCTPIVNLFEQVAEPIVLDQGRYEYRIVPDVGAPRGMEIYSIDEVTSTDPATSVTTTYRPFYSFHHTRNGDDGADVLARLAPGFDARRRPRHRPVSASHGSRFPSAAAGRRHARRPHDLHESRSAESIAACRRAAVFRAGRGRAARRNPLPQDADRAAASAAAPRPLLGAGLAFDAQLSLARRPDRRARCPARNPAALRFQRSAGRAAAVGRRDAAVDRGDHAARHAANHRPHRQPRRAAASPVAWK